MGSVTACYHKLYLHETHRDTVMLMFVLLWHRPYCTVDMYIVYTYIHTYTCVYMHVLKLLHSTVDAACKQTHTHTLCNVILDLNENMANIGVSPAELAIHTLLESKSFYVL